MTYNGIDKKLWKLLRAGGLGHKAAGALADSNSEYYLKGFNDRDAGHYWQVLLGAQGFNAQHTVPRGDYDGFNGHTLRAPVQPFTAGSVILCGLSGWNDPDDDPFNGLLIISVNKFADAAGVPVAGTNVYNGNVRRTNGVWTTPSQGGDGSFSKSTGGDYVTLTCVTPGFYNASVGVAP